MKKLEDFIQTFMLGEADRYFLTDAEGEPNAFTFTIESDGRIAPHNIFFLALGILENKVDAYIELWKSTNKDRTKFAKIYQSKVVPISLKKLKKDDLLNLCKENGIKTSSNDNIDILISKLNEKNIYEL